MTSQELPILEHDANAQPQGIGGWLLFFCVCLTVFTPLVGIFALSTFFLVYHDPTLALQFFGPAIFKYKLLVSVAFLLSLGVILGGLYCGIQLLKKVPNAIKITKTFLVYGFLFSLFNVGIKYFIYHNIGSAEDSGLYSVNSNRELLVELSQAVIYFGIWYSYLTNSKRVKNTFPET